MVDSIAHPEALQRLEEMFNELGFVSGPPAVVAALSQDVERVRNLVLSDLAKYNNFAKAKESLHFASHERARREHQYLAQSLASPSSSLALFVDLLSRPEWGRKFVEEMSHHSKHIEGFDFALMQAPRKGSIASFLRSDRSVTNLEKRLATGDHPDDSVLGQALNGKTAEEKKFLTRAMVRAFSGYKQAQPPQAGGPGPVPDSLSQHVADYEDRVSYMAALAMDAGPVLGIENPSIPSRLSNETLAEMMRKAQHSHQQLASQSAPAFEMAFTPVDLVEFRVGAEFKDRIRLENRPGNTLSRGEWMMHDLFQEHADSLERDANRGYVPGLPDPSNFPDLERARWLRQSSAGSVYEDIPPHLWQAVEKELEGLEHPWVANLSRSGLGKIWADTISAFEGDEPVAQEVAREMMEEAHRQHSQLVSKIKGNQRFLEDIGPGGDLHAFHEVLSSSVGVREWILELSKDPNFFKDGPKVIESTILSRAGDPSSITANILAQVPEDRRAKAAKDMGEIFKNVTHSNSVLRRFFHDLRQYGEDSSGMDEFPGKFRDSWVARVQRLENASHLDPNQQPPSSNPIDFLPSADDVFLSKVRGHLGNVADVGYPLRGYIELEEELMKGRSRAASRSVERVPSRSDAAVSEPDLPAQIRPDLRVIDSSLGIFPQDSGREIEAIAPKASQESGQGVFSFLKNRLMGRRGVQADSSTSPRNGSSYKH